MDEVSPIAIFKEEIARRGWSIQQAADELGVNPPTLYSVTGATPRKISTKLAIQLSAKLGETIEFWLSDKVPADSILELVAKGAGSSSFESTQAGVLNDEMLDYLLGLADGPIRLHPFRPEAVQPASVDYSSGWFITKGFDKLTRSDWIRIGLYKINKDLLTLDEREHVEFLLEEYGIIGSSEDSRDVEIEETFILEPRESVYVIGAEALEIGLNYVARIGQRTQNTLQGIQVLHGFQVDPGYRGPLVAFVANMGPKPVKLNAGDPMLSLEFTRLASPATRPYIAKYEAQLAHVASAYCSAVLAAFTYQRDADGVPVAARLSISGPLLRSEGDSTFDERLLEWFHQGLGDARHANKKLISETATLVMEAVPLSQTDASILAKYLNLSDVFENRLRAQVDAGWDLSLRNVMEQLDPAGEGSTLASTLIMLGSKHNGQTEETES